VNLFSAFGNLIEAIFSGFSGMLIGIFGLAILITCIGAIWGHNIKREEFKGWLGWCVIIFAIALLAKVILTFVQTNAH
jgi:divalent metal cation (Fe/Co/Zn/Cd) transporter